MLRSFQSQCRGLLVVLAIAAFALGACGSGSGTPAPTGTPTTTATGQPGVTTQPTAVVTGPAGAARALAGVGSYKFTMTVEGGSLGDTLSLLPAASTENASFAISGTYIQKPEPAADVTVKGSIHVIYIAGFDYVDSDGTGFTKSEAISVSPLATAGPTASPGADASASDNPNGPAAPSYSDSLSPVAFLLAFDFAKGFDKAGSEKKNGVDTDHYVVNDSGKAALAQMGSVTGVPDATWTAELWIAQTGGYPVKLAVTATATDASGGSSVTVFQRLLDITNINDAANKVTAPENVTGA